MENTVQTSECLELACDFEQLKNTSLNLVCELQTLMGSEYQTGLLDINQSIKESKNLDLLSPYLRNMIVLTTDFLKQDQSNKQESTIYLKQFVKKMYTLEKEFSASYEIESQYHDNDFSFSKKIKAGIINVSDSVDTLATFDELRSYISSNLETLLDTFEDKIKEYNSRIEKSSKEHNRIQENFKSLIGHIQERNKLLEEQSRLDPLTGIFNRRVFEDRIAFEFDRFHRYHKSFSLVFFDIDNFKTINDRCGHEAGDKVLQAIAKLVENHVRKTDVFARYGGEEFAVILPETDVIHGIKVASKLRHAIETTEFEYNNQKVPVTISSGVTEIKEEDAQYQSIVNRADKYMYIAKQNGRNLVMSDFDDA